MAKSVLDIDYPQDQDHEPEQIHAPEQPYVSGHTRLERNALGIDCIFDRHTGKLLRKTERRVGDASTAFAYEFDSAGRLCKVTRNGSLAEEYHYNQAGQRVYQCRLSGNRSENSADGESTLEYDEEGLLRRAGKTYFAYNPNGALAARRDRRGDTKFFYGHDTGLDRIKLPDGTEISYVYTAENPDNPVKRLWHDCPVAEYTWQDPLRLTAYRDHELQLDYVFTYTPAGGLDRVRITPKLQRRARTPPPDADWVDAGPIGVYRENTPPPAPDQADNLDEWLRAMADPRAGTVYELFKKYGAPLTLYCACDQVGTLKLLTDKNGNLVKEVLRDSFGVLYYDSLPDLFIPIGFAGGLTDPDTDLIRFGKRDYDPNIGRFTAPDPARDLRGDGDLYDYCADDPVSRKDPSGEGWFAPFALKQLSKQVGKRIAKALGERELSAEEEIMPVRREIQKLERKIASGPVAKELVDRLHEYRQKEDELWEEYGEAYTTHSREFYRNYFPDDGYADRKMREALKRRAGKNE